MVDRITSGIVYNIVYYHIFISIYNMWILIYPYTSTRHNLWGQCVKVKEDIGETVTLWFGGHPGPGRV